LLPRRQEPRRRDPRHERGAYPYVYITARASFVAQSVSVFELRRTLGRNAAETFWRVALPLARPALATGAALALMDKLNDISSV
jgi:iron(III) transport system permease protein